MEVDHVQVLDTDIILNDEVPTTQVLSTTSHNVARGRRSVYELDCIPLWGTVSICGERSEMEDAVRALPHFLKIPIRMLMGDHEGGISPTTLTYLTSHFFGVYDGHRGAQVADYCHARIHFALVERIKEEMCNKNTGECSRQVQWEKVFVDCYRKVDDEVKGRISRPVSGSGSSDRKVLQAVSPETVGSTAVVALPDREDEYERIEKAGGKVIQWQGARVSGILAMSRSIGMSKLQIFFNPDPEVTFMPRAREDECLILASDGLWDVMSNQEVCELARKRILMWHKKNGSFPLAERGVGEDHACQGAAAYLSKLALRKGSKDNVSIIVVDLKAQRKFKTRSLKQVDAITLTTLKKT